MLTQINRLVSIDLDLLAQGNAGRIVTIRYIETYKDKLTSGEPVSAGRIIISSITGVVYDLKDCPRESVKKICDALGLKRQETEKEVRAEGVIQIGPKKPSRAISLIDKE